MELRNNQIKNTLEALGLENLLQRIITSYEDYQNIPAKNQTPVSEITRRTANGLTIHGGLYNLYLIEGFAIKGLYCCDGECVLYGFQTCGEPLEKCYQNWADTLISVTEFINQNHIEIDRLIEKISQAH